MMDYDAKEALGDMTDMGREWLAKATKYKPNVAPGAPTADAGDVRICFSVAYYTDEENAKKADAAVRKAGHTINGGWFHGSACGRDSAFDFKWQGLTYRAVTY